jgi:hypothetical protein
MTTPQQNVDDVSSEMENGNTDSYLQWLPRWDPVGEAVRPEEAAILLVHSSIFSDDEIYHWLNGDSSR